MDQLRDPDQTDASRIQYENDQHERSHLHDTKNKKEQITACQDQKKHWVSHHPMEKNKDPLHDSWDSVRLDLGHSTHR